MRPQRQRRGAVGGGSSRDVEESGEDLAMVSRLGDDTLLNILHRLPTRYLLSAVALVCRHWKRLCEDHLVHDVVPPLFSVTAKPWGKMTEKQLMTLVKRHASTVEVLELCGLKKLSSEEIQEMVSGLPRLQHLTIISHPPVITSNLQTLVHHLPSQLSILDLHTHKWEQHKYINTIRPPSITDDFVTVLQQRCPSLTKLTLDADSLISEPCLDGLLKTWSSLTLLHLHSSVLGWGAVLRVFESCPSLQDLSLTSTRLLVSINYNYPGTSSSDNKLMEPIAIYSKQTLAAVMPQSLVSLRLYLDLHASVPWDSLPAVDLLRFKGYQLQQLHAQCLYSNSWQSIYLWCINLKSLDLSHTFYILPHVYSLTQNEEKVLCNLVRHLKKLEELALPGATDRVLVEIGLHCANLSTLFFKGQMPQKYGSPLKQRHITDRGVIALAEGCPALRVLGLGGCINLTISPIRILAFECRKLEVLELNGCTKLTDDVIPILLNRLGSSLVYLDIVNCRGMTSNALHAVLQYVKERETTLRVLDIHTTLKRSSKHVLHELKMLAPYLKIRDDSSGLNWIGFYRSSSWSYNS